jgi:hypothetical protein
MKKFYSFLVLFSIFVFVSGAALTPLIAQQGPEIRITNNNADSDQPDVAYDSNGNIHIVYFDDDEGTGYADIYYTMLDNNGTVLIDGTRISDYAASRSVQPTIAVDTNDSVHVVWMEYWGWCLTYTKLNPGLDDQNGDAANPATITVVDDTYLYCYDYGMQHPRLAIDSNDDVHIVWAERYYYDYPESIMYMKLDNNGVELIAPTTIMACNSWFSRPDIALDSNDDVHITWNTNEYTQSYEVYYAKLDGSDGSTLIDETLITPDDGRGSRRQTIVIDSDNKVHIIWHNGGGSAAVIYYTKLDPSLDDQNGDAANEGVITLINDTPLTTDDETYPSNPQSAIYDGAYIYIAYYMWQLVNNVWFNDVYFKIIDTNGGVVLPSIALTTTGTVDASTSRMNNQANLAVDANGKAHVVWCDNRDGGYEVYYTNNNNDTDGDGMPNDKELGDRDGDGIPDFVDLDPTGWIYHEIDGQIIAGGSIQVIGPGPVNIIHNASNGYYQWTVQFPGVYTMFYTPPAGYAMSTICLPQAGDYDPNPANNPNIVGQGTKNGTTNYLTDWLCSHNPYYFSFDLQIGDPIVINNNIPLQQQAPTAVTLSSFDAVVEDNGIVIRWTTAAEPNCAGFCIHRSEQENGEYMKLNSSMIAALGNSTTGASYSYTDTPEEATTYYYKLESITLQGECDFYNPIFVSVTSVDIKKYIGPDNYSLSQNYPNPFNPETTIEFGLPKHGFVELSIYDINGKLVRILVSEEKRAGNHWIKWDARDDRGVLVSSGVYFYFMKVNDSDSGAGFMQSNKMILMK